MNMNIIGKLQEIFSDIMDSDDIRLDENTDIRELEGWDSLKQITFMASVQDEFGVEFSLDEIAELNIVSDICSSINNKIGN